MKTAQKAKNKAAQKPQEALGVAIHCSYTDLRPTAALRPNPGNPNGHPEAQVEKLAKVIAAHGWRHPITVSRRSGLVVSGHCRLMAAQKLGLAEVPIDEQDFASEAEEMAVLIADNVVQELAEVDGLKMAELLCELDQADYDLSLTALSKEQIDDYIIGPVGSDPKDDEVPEPPKKAETQPGDLYILGEHRLLCGDSTKAEDVAMLCPDATCCFTSPPYNAGAYTLTGNIVKKDKSSRYDNASDDLPEDEYFQFLVDFTQLALSRCALVAVNLQQLAGNKFAVLRWISHFTEHFVDRAIWYKGHGNPAMAPSVMASRYEDIWLLSPEQRPSRAIPTIKFRGTVENVFESVGASAENECAATHAATMPISVCLWALSSWTESNATIYEPFLGSGTTLIACEKLKRRCFGMEIDPIYTDVCVKRFVDYVGNSDNIYLIRQGKKLKWPVS